MKYKPGDILIRKKYLGADGIELYYLILDASENNQKPFRLGYLGSDTYTCVCYLNGNSVFSQLTSYDLDGDGILAIEIPPHVKRAFDIEIMKNVLGK